LDRKQVIADTSKPKSIFAKNKVTATISYTSNPFLETVKPGWKGTQPDEDGLFINHEYP
jgi:hypothetical protein